MTDNRVFAEQIRRNALLVDSWTRYGGHREHVMKLLLAETGRNRKSLRVVGAGNCHDLDLAALVEHFSTVRLIDLDKAAMVAGVRRQQLEGDPRIELVAEDVTEVGEYLQQLSPDTPAHDPALQYCLAGAAIPDFGEPCDVTASICLLTQLIESVHLCVGRGHPVSSELCLRIRDQHLRALHNSVLPGGTIVLITDIVSSDTCAELPSTPAVDLPRLVSRQINERNFFTGANPFAIQAFYHDDPVVSPEVARVDVSLPWLWDFGIRVYAVSAIVIHRAS